MMIFDLDTFYGLIPVDDPRALPENNAQSAVNCRLYSKKLGGWRGNEDLLTLSGVATIRSIYHMGSPANITLQSSTYGVDYVQGPLAGDTKLTTYFTGLDKPRVTNKDMAAAGGPPFPGSSNWLGLPAGAAPTVADVAETGTVSGFDRNEVTGASGPISADHLDVSYTCVDDVAVHLDVNYSTRAMTTDSQAQPVTLQISRGGVVIKQIVVNVSANGARPSEPSQIKASGNIKFVDKPPNGTGATTYRFTIVDGFTGATGYLRHFDYTIVYSGTRIVTVNSGHGQVAGNSIHFDGLGGLAKNVNGQRFTLTKVDATHMYIASDDLHNYTTGGTWTRVFRLTETTDRSYTFTYLSNLGGIVQEGPPSDPSPVSGVGDGQSELITFPAAPDANYGVTGLRLYRTSVDSNNESHWLLVHEFSSGAPSPYTDAVKDKNLGIELISDTWIKPPASLTGLTSMDNGMLVGFTGFSVYFCEPFQPHAWPLEYSQALAHKLVALCSLGGTVAAITQGPVYLGTGRHPSVVSFEALPGIWPCLAKESVVGMDGFCVYASQDGLVMVTPTSVDLVTQDIFTSDEWSHYVHGGLFTGTRWDNRYVGFNPAPLTGDPVGFVFDPTNPVQTFTLLDYAATATFVNPETGDVYIVVDDVKLQILGGDGDEDNALEFTWRSRRTVLPQSICPSAAQVEANGYPVHFKLYSVETVDAAVVLTLRHEQDVPDSQPFRLQKDLAGPDGYLAKEFEFEVSGAGDFQITRVCVSDSMDEISES